MSAPLVISIQHRLGLEEAVRRLKSRLATIRNNYGALITVEHEAWVGNKLTFSLRALGQASSATIDVFDDRLQIEVFLPWLLARFANLIVPTVRKEATLLLEKK
jgi:Putative polyhydroxyalkanoic acid system protein (PHA_gran_rgn)